MTDQSKKKINTGRGYAWLLREGLCHWATSDPMELEAEGKPSPEARIVAVRIVRETDWRKLK
jgi:hypothetical protein